MSGAHSYLILGASSDVGVELIRRLNGREENALFLAHCNSGADALARIVAKNGNALRTLPCDLGDGARLGRFIDEVASAVDAPTHIVHLAAPPFLHTKPTDFDEERFFRSMRVQVSSFLSVVRRFLPVMQKRKAHNKIVAVLSSVTLGKPPAQLLEYTAVKHALWGAVKSLASDTAGKRLNVNAVSPSMIGTKFLGGIDERIVRLCAEGSPEGRIARVEDIVPAIEFLLSPGANYIHGVNLNVSNGGAW